MDSKGRVLTLEEDHVAARTSEPVPDLTRGHLVLAAMDAGHAAGWPAWWPALAPLTAEERSFVRRHGVPESPRHG